MIQSMKLRGALLMLSWVATPASAHAEARWCTWTAGGLLLPTTGGSLACQPDERCVADDTCGGRACVVPPGATRGACAPPCSTIRLAEEASDCPGAFVALDGVPPRRFQTVMDEEVEAVGFVPTGYCMLPNETGCTGVPGPRNWTDWEQGYLRDETSGPVARSHTNDWAFGLQAGPCASTLLRPGSCVADRPVGRCEVSRETGIACGAGGECSTLIGCNPGRLLFSDACPSEAPGGQVGACIPTEGRGTLPLGVCVYLGWFAACGEVDNPGRFEDCFSAEDPMTGAPRLQSNFYEGDCDNDGCPNGYDPNPCLPCDGAACLIRSRAPNGACGTTREAESEACDFLDAAVVVDAGVMAPDANVPAVTFGGGGGLVCSAGAGNSPRALGLVALCLALVGTWRRRRADG